MRLLVVILPVVLFVNIVAVLAQDEPDAVKHCLDTSMEPIALADVEIDGTLFISSGDGTRAIRNPIPTPYVIAFSDHYRNFGSIGSFSPDGRWFAYYSGTSGWGNVTARNYSLNQLNFVDTYSGQQIFSVPVEKYIFFVSYSHPVRPWDTIDWLDNDTYIIFPHTAFNNTDEIRFIDTDTQREESYEGTLPVAMWLSPDRTHAISGGQIINVTTDEILVEDGDIINWLPDGSGYYIQTLEPSNTSIYNMDGVLRYSHDNHRVQVSQTGTFLAWPNTDITSFYILNTETGETIDLCLSGGSIMFSPDEGQAAIRTSPDGKRQLWFVDTETWQGTLTDANLPDRSLFVGWWNISP